MKTGEARMAVFPRLRYRDLAERGPIATWIPFPLAGFDDDVMPVWLRLDRSYVYEAELLFVPASTPARAPLILDVRGGHPQLHRADVPASTTPAFVPFMEGEKLLLRLDAYVRWPHALSTETGAWTHPAPPPVSTYATVVLGKGGLVDPEATDIEHPLVDLPCTGHAWWRRLEVLLDVLEAMAAPYEAFCRDAMKAAGLANGLHGFLVAMGLSEPSVLIDPECRAVMRSYHGMVQRIRGVLDGTLSSKVLRFLQQYSNVCTLVWQLLCARDFQRELERLDRSAPAIALEHRHLIVRAASLLGRVPSGWEPEPGGDGSVVTRAPHYGQAFVARFLRPWIEKALGPKGEPTPEVYTSLPPIPRGFDSAGSPLGVVKVARKSAFGLIGIFVGPVVLAVAYTLLDDWMNEGTERS